MAGPTLVRPPTRVDVSPAREIAREIRATARYRAVG